MSDTDTQIPPTTTQPTSAQPTGMQPTSARAVLSTRDFELIREAVMFYMTEHRGQPEADKFVHLYHRLGSAIPRR